VSDSAAVSDEQAKKGRTIGGTGALGLESRRECSILKSGFHSWEMVSSSLNARKSIPAGNRSILSTPARMSREASAGCLKGNLRLQHSALTNWFPPHVGGRQIDLGIRQFRETPPQAHHLEEAESAVGIQVCN
jgi:hypothetical protein